MRQLLVIALLAAVATPVAAQTAAPSGGPAPTERDIRELSIIFKQIDADRNGRLTKVEMSAYGTRRNMGTLVKPKGWRDLDANGDGTLTLEEFIPGMVSARARMRSGQPG